MLQMTSELNWLFSSQDLAVPKISRKFIQTSPVILITDRRTNVLTNWKKHNPLDAGKSPQLLES